MNLEEIAKSPFAGVLREYLLEEIAKLSDISTIKGTIEEKAKVLEGRQEATKILHKLFKGLELKKNLEIIKTKYN
jgi:hypothetical protein